MSLAIKMKLEPLRSLAFGSIGAAYVGVGSVLSNPARILFIQNLTDAQLLFSLDGIDDHFPLPASGFILLDVSSNKTLGEGLFLAENSRLYVKEDGTPTSGSVYFTVFYGGST
jgi:mannitol-specific phosphotransferase system IIBC component